LHNNDSVNFFGTANISMSQLSEWFIANRLGLNLKKLVIVYSDLSRKVDQVDQILHIDGQQVQKTQCCKYLGRL